MKRQQNQNSLKQPKPQSLQKPRLGCWLGGLACALGLVLPQSSEANGGPFILKYPGGDPAAKGVLARLDPSLKPTREEKLKVSKEELTVAFGAERFGPTQSNQPPLASVSAKYFITNPTPETVEVDFGFPILRGIYVSPWAMMPMPDVSVSVRAGNTETNVRANVISTSAMYGWIRARARESIEAALTADPGLQERVAAVRQAAGEEREKARTALAGHARERLKWNERDAALLVEYVSVDLGKPTPPAFTLWTYSYDETLRNVVGANQGFLGAIGEQKTTQFLAHLCSLLAPGKAPDYQAIYEAWGGEIKERSLDIKTQTVRPRIYQADRIPGRPVFEDDPTLYARVDYLDSKAGLSESEKATCTAVLKNLPVTFTFAPMNLLHYRVSFAPGAEQVVTVSYAQRAYSDTQEPATYQLAYVVHPASLWKEFGPIELVLRAPEGVSLAASVPTREIAVGERVQPEMATNPRLSSRLAPQPKQQERRGEVRAKTGELFVAIDRKSWQESVAASATSGMTTSVVGSPLNPPAAAAAIGAAKPN